MSSLYENITSLLLAQTELIDEVCRIHSKNRRLNVLKEVPKTGNINLLNSDWNYRKHGDGICFTDKKAGTVVDLEVQPHRPELFSAWRLSLYLESIGDEEVSERSLAQILDTLVSAGLIKYSVTNRGLYELNLPQP